jgi:hypothetical protein
MSALEEARSLLRQIAYGKFSIITANNLECIPVDHFYDTELYDKLGEALALYAPTEHSREYWSESELRALAARVLPYFYQLANSPYNYSSEDGMIRDPIGYPNNSRIPLDGSPFSYPPS